jgi:hypothetical protein
MYDAFVSHVHKFCLYLGANIDFGYFFVIIHMLKVNSVSLFSYDRKILRHATDKISTNAF